MIIENERLISVSDQEIKNGTVIIPNGLKTIGKCAFYRCKNLRYINIPEGIEDIKYAAFNSCENLTSVTLPKGLKHIKDYAFAHCRQLKSVDIPESLTTIGKCVFTNCVNLSNINFPKRLKRIGIFAFHGCNLPAYTDKDEIIDIALKILSSRYGLCTCLDEATRAVSLKHKVIISVTSTFPNFRKEIAIEKFGGSGEGFWWDKYDKEIRKKFLEYLRDRYYNDKIK